jgi:hypothetical protein
MSVIWILRVPEGTFVFLFVNNQGCDGGLVRLIGHKLGFFCFVKMIETSFVPMRLGQGHLKSKQGCW